MEIETLANRIRGEYVEMPGLRLTMPQACRLWQLDRATCEAILDILVKEGFLLRTRDDAFLALPRSSAPLKTSSVPARLKRTG